MTTPQVRDFRLAQNEYLLHVSAEQDIGAAGLGNKVVVPVRSRCRGAFINIDTEVTLATTVQPFRNASAQPTVRSYVIPADTGPNDDGDEFEYADFESDVDDAGADAIFHVGDSLALSSNGASAANSCGVTFLMRKE